MVCLSLVVGCIPCSSNRLYLAEHQEKTGEQAAAHDESGGEHRDGQEKDAEDSEGEADQVEGLEVSPAISLVC